MNKTQFKQGIFICMLVGCFLFILKNSSTAQAAAGEATPAQSVKVVKMYKHDKNAFTQGLLYVDGVLYESTGVRGQSSIRKVKLETGEVLKKSNLPDSLFGEGLAFWKNQFVQLSWQAGVALVYEKESFKLSRVFRYKGEGWGLTTNEDGFIMSDGTADIRFLDPETFREVKRITVKDQGKEIKMLNELEFINGEIYANVWLTNKIVRIDPESGKVIAWVDLSILVPKGYENNQDAVLNGIAYDTTKKRLFVTGKLWPKLFEVEIVENQ